MAITQSSPLRRFFRLETSNHGNGNGRSAAQEKPLRSELFSISQLERHAKTVAGWHGGGLNRGGGYGRNRLLPRLDENEKVLRREYELIAAAARRGRRITPAAEWFLDNFYLIEEQIRTARRHLPRGYSRELPRLTAGPSAGLPRVYDIALELISHVDGRIDAENVRAFAASYQTATALKLGELWAIPIMLRLALLENLRRVVLRMSANHRDAERAEHWVRRMAEISVSDPAKLVLVLAEMVKEDFTLTSAFVSEFATRLHGQGTALIFPIHWLEQRLAEQGKSLEQVFQEASQNQAANQVSIGNSITSLRYLAAADWRDFVESLSVVESTLSRDPAGVYAKMDFATRDSYRHAVERTARQSLASEEEVAAAVVELAEKQAGGNGHGPVEAAARRHVGYFLIDDGQPALERAVAMRPTLKQRVSRWGRRCSLLAYLGSGTLIIAAVTAAALWWAARHGFHLHALALITLPLAICASQLAIALVHWTATLLVQPRMLPRLDFAKGVPPQQATVVAVPTLLTDQHEADELLQDLEIRYLANRDASVHFALLTDLRDAPTEETPGDAALLQYAKEGIEALNAKYMDSEDPRRNQGGGFFLFHRARKWNPREGVWMGWERKRGKLEDFNAYLRGGGSKFAAIVGPAELLKDIQYVITLDTDTQLPRDAAKQLIGTIAHPLNRPQYDQKLGRVTRGYGILQPRVTDSMPSTYRSNFARLFSGEPGIDPYTRAVSDVYQDVFHEGSFVGKGIYDVGAMGRALDRRLPEDRILSHDLLEGSYARSGLISDVTLVEDFPSTYPADVSRRHRWMRGDWQIATWLLPRVPGGERRWARNSISALSQWKILDNLRRSLVPICALIVLLCGWFLGESLFFTLFVVLMFLLPSLLGGLEQLARWGEESSLGQRVRRTIWTIGRQILGQLFALATLPYEAYVSLDAIVRTWIRLLMTRRKLLEWRTARDAARAARAAGVSGFYISMWPQTVMAGAVLLGHFLIHREASAVAAPIVGMWLLAPSAAWWLSRPAGRARPKLAAEEVAFLRKLARRTWRFFETFIAAEDNYLPPDNFQEDPPNGIAHRTSPTNMGLSLLANFAALDFGYLSIGGMMDRFNRTLASMDKMQRYRGHFYNWYDTRTLDPMRPLYVSTVDSGNLAGHLLTCACGLEMLEERKILTPALFEGLGDTVDLAVEAARGATAAPEYMSSAKMQDALARLQRMRDDLRTAPPTLQAAHALLSRTASAAAEAMRAAEPRAGGELRAWTQALETQCRQCADDLAEIAPWIRLATPPAAIWRRGDEPGAAALGELQKFLRGLDDGPTLAEMARLETKLLPLIDAVPLPVDDWFRQLRVLVTQGSERASQRLKEALETALRCREFADIEYEFLYDSSRRLLALGYNAGEHRRDSGFYDLLASEARLASFVAIAQDKLPQEHWFSLGRQLTTFAGGSALLSWSGSMFEYLMPLLVMPTQPHTLLDETYRLVVKRQMEYGRGHDVPWGVSESEFHEIDAQLNYQYRAFGIPGLGLKRGLADDLVIAPYACAMALMISPEAACANLRRMASEGYLGKYGFYEAVDYTPARLPPGQSSAVVRSFMAHHEGMSLLALGYLLLDQPMQRRFVSDPAVRATELLLHERLPKTPAVDSHQEDVPEIRGKPVAEQSGVRFFASPQTPAPEVHLLSNGKYHVAVTAAGGGYSRWGDIAVTRWHEDLARDCWGSFCYVRDTASGEFWSTAHQPTLKRASSYEAVFVQGRAEFRRRDGEIETRMDIAVSPEDDIELRRVTITNRGSAARTIELTSYAEVVLATPAADAAHPAFSNLFVQTELLRQRQAILCTRRPRSAAERPPFMLHLMAVEGATAGSASFETGRAEFIGRGRSLADPAAMYRPTLTDTEGFVLDPIAAIRNTLSVEPDQTVRLNLVTGIAATREAAVKLIEKYQDSRLADRVFELAWTHNQVILRQINTTEGETQLYGRLAGSVLYANSLLRAPMSVIARNRRGQSGLWGYGISGDLPIVLLKIGDREQIELVHQLVAAHAYWRLKGLAVDLVIWNEDQSGYRQALQDLVMGIISSRAESNRLDKPGGIFVRRAEQIPEEDKILMQTVARVIVSDNAGTLAEQTSRRARAEPPVRRFSPAQIKRRSEKTYSLPGPRKDLAAFNGMGGFTPDGREYVITTTADRRTPAPWCNVLANPFFGSVVSESGGAYTWCENAQAFRLTPWHNDPITDVSGEAFYIRDEESGEFWSPCPQPAGGPWAYTTRHGFGYTIFEYFDGDIASEMQTFVATDAPVKFVVLKLRNRSGRQRRLSLTGYYELVMGERRSSNLPYIVTESDPKTGAILARNAYNGEFSERVAFMDCSEGHRTITGDRVEFLGRNGRLAAPACMSRANLSGRVGAGLDPCAAMQAAVDLQPNQEYEVAFIFGCGRDLGDAQNLITRFRGMDPARGALWGVWEFWKRELGAVRVETPDASFNYLVNGWLLYQTLACRIWARSGFYQSGGAFGFRDQLQDVCALIHTEPGLMREHLLRCASRQFREGDVQHWWHPPRGRGVRTRISDDYLWLPLAVCRYVSAIGDTGVLDEKIHFLEGRQVNPNEESYYDLPAVREETGTLYEHCLRAIRFGLRMGANGLPLMGCGDWNDGMNLVGEHGKGESVWLAFFLYDVLRQFGELAKRRNDQAVLDLCAAESEKLRKAIDEHAWDGGWYRRAYFDDGQPLGSASNEECKIDSLPQSWAVLSGAGEESRNRTAMEAVDQHLVNRDLKLIQLFEPAFDHSALNPGYIKGYPPGVRENGGQYTHAAVWVVMAFAKMGDTQRAWELFNLINPIHHGESEGGMRKYKIEPYVLAGDVYTNLQHAGRGGWSWYTGSTGWMYRLATESLLGLKLEVDRLRVNPLLPEKWESIKIHYRYRRTFYHIQIRNHGGKTVSHLVVDGAVRADQSIPLVDDQRDHWVEIELEPAFDASGTV